VDREPDQTGIMYEDGTGMQVVSGDADCSIQAGAAGERKCCGVDLRGPEDRLDESRRLRVGREIATPIAVRIRAPSRLSVARWTATRNKPVCSRDCAAGIPRQAHLG
jgi:hypothetical protein